MSQDFRGADKPYHHLPNPLNKLITPRTRGKNHSAEHSSYKNLGDILQQDKIPQAAKTSVAMGLSNFPESPRAVLAPSASFCCSSLA
ncbi:MAG: hypothetical protein R2880_09810 [Deinococcales bacterium]